MEGTHTPTRSNSPIRVKQLITNYRPKWSTRLRIKSYNSLFLFLHAAHVSRYPFGRRTATRANVLTLNAVTNGPAIRTAVEMFVVPVFHR